MEQYNRKLAANPRFQAATGCRPSTYCEDTYRKGAPVKGKRDPRCPGEPKNLAQVALDGSAKELAILIPEFSDHTAASRDALTQAFLVAVGSAKWEHADMLLRAGADINGRVFDVAITDRKWFDSPLATIFGDGRPNGSSKIARARWLFARGLNFSNPNAHEALTRAAVGNEMAEVDFLLAQGASPNGIFSTEELDKLGRLNIASAGGGYGYGSTPFYAAIDLATQNWSRLNAAEIAHGESAARKGRINAVKLYNAGARFIVGMEYDNLRQKPDIKVASLLLAAAHREGRLQDLIDRILYPTGKDDPLKVGATQDERDLVTYLQKVDSCPYIRPRAQRDFIKLCIWGSV